MRLRWPKAVDRGGVSGSDERVRRERPVRTCRLRRLRPADRRADALAGERARDLARHGDRLQRHAQQVAGRFDVGVVVVVGAEAKLGSPVHVGDGECAGTYSRARGSPSRRCAHRGPVHPYGRRSRCRQRRRPCRRRAGRSAMPPTRQHRDRDGEHHAWVGETRQPRTTPPPSAWRRRRCRLDPGPPCLGGIGVARALRAGVTACRRCSARRALRRTRGCA